MNDLKPSDPTPENLPPKGVKLARVSRILGWVGLVIAASTIPLLIVLFPYGGSVEVVMVMAALGVSICLGGASIVCAWRARVSFALSQAPGNRGKLRRRLLLFAWTCLVYLALLGASLFCYSREMGIFSVVCGQASKVDFAVMQWEVVEGKHLNDEVMPTNAWMAYFLGMQSVHGEVLEPPRRVGELASVRLTRRLLAYPPGTRISRPNLDGPGFTITLPQGAPKHYGKTNADLPYNRKMSLPFLPFGWMFLEARGVD